MRRLLLVAAVAALLLLPGCALLSGRAPGEPELVVRAGRGQPCVQAEVLGGRYTAFAWDWGDGTVEHTSEPRAYHCYASPGLYRLTVVARRERTKEGGPPWLKEAEEVVLSAEVDSRPRVLLRKVVVELASPPPNWYSPDWPEYYFPAACPLYASADLLFLEQVPFRLTFTLFGPEGMLLLQAQDRLLIPGEVFLAKSCPAEITPYRLACALEVDGQVQTLTITIYAVPPNRRPNG